MKVVLGYPFASMVHGAFAECLTRLAQRKTKIKVDFRGQSGPYIHYNRNQLCKYALETGADYLMQIDADMEFPPEARPVRRSTPRHGAMPVPLLAPAMGGLEAEQLEHLLHRDFRTQAVEVDAGHVGSSDAVEWRVG